MPGAAAALIHRPMKLSSFRALASPWAVLLGPAFAAQSMSCPAVGGQALLHPASASHLYLEPKKVPAPRQLLGPAPPPCYGPVQ